MSQVERDGVMIPLPEKHEEADFGRWLKDNQVNDPFHPDHHYDYVGAFRAGEGRAAGEAGHFTDKFKLPGHETFSVESQYSHIPRFRKYAGRWDGENYVKPWRSYAQDEQERKAKPFRYSEVK